MSQPKKPENSPKKPRPKRSKDAIERAKATTLKKYGKTFYSDISKMLTPEKRFTLFDDPELASYYARQGGKANKAPRHFKRDPEAAREAGRLGAQKRWAKHKTTE